MKARVKHVATLFVSFFIISTIHPANKKLQNQSFKSRTLNVNTDLNEKIKEPKKKKKLFRFGKKAFTDMTYAELKDAKTQKVAANDTYAAMKYLERMIKMCTNIAELADLMVEYANLLFDDGQFTKAGQLYAEFTRLYPGHEKTEYALYRAIICSDYDILSADRDQSQTHDTIALADEFLGKDTYDTYKKEVKTIRSRCYTRLVESELNVCDFYLNKGSMKAVNNRLKTVKSDFLPKAPQAESLVLAFELKVAEKQGKDVTQLVAQKAGLPAQEITKVAQDKKKRRAADRF